MDLGLIAAVVFSSMLVLLVIGVPIAFAMLASACLGYLLLGRPELASQQLILTLDDQGTNFAFIAVPLYFMMGELVYRTKLADDLFECVHRWVGRLPGGLAISSVVSCAGFGSVSGGSISAIATIAPMSIPAMRRYKYDDALATGSIAAAGSLGILIPPSIVMVGYGLLTETSIGALFIAGIIPGIILTIMYAATVTVRCMIRPELGPIGERYTIQEKIESLGKVLPILLTFLVVVGGIYFGVFTPTEAAGFGVAVLLIIAFVMRRLSLQIVRVSLLRSMHISAMIFVIIIGGHMMGKIVTLTGVSQNLVALINGADLHPALVMLLITALYIVLGMVLDVWGMLILTVPFVLPVMIGLGYGPIWYGVYAVIMSELALITPPVGINVYVMAKMVPDVPLRTIFRGVTPFFVATLLLVALICAFPQIVMFLPTLGGMR